MPHFRTTYPISVADRTHQNMIAMLKDECRENLVKAVSVIESRFSALCDGSITIGDFNMILEKGDKFPELAELAQTKGKHFVTKVLHIRQKEIDQFTRQAEGMATVAALCQHLPNGEFLFVLFGNVNEIGLNNIADKFLFSNRNPNIELVQQLDTLML